MKKIIIVTDKQSHSITLSNKEYENIKNSQNFNNEMIVVIISLCEDFTVEESNMNLYALRGGELLESADEYYKDILDE